MNGWQKKATAFLAVSCLLLGLAACGAPNGSNGAGNGAGNGGAASEGGQTNAGESGTPAVTTLKYWAAYDGLGTSGKQDNAIMKELTRRTGVELDITFNLKQENYNAMLASGDLPDVFTVWNKDVKNLIDGGHVIDMEPLLEAHGQDILKDKGKIEFGKQFLSDGQNKLYFLPTWGIGLDSQPAKTFDDGTGIGAFVRWDVYKQIGYPEWKGDLMDLIPILKQMQEAQPTTAEGKKVYALSPWLGDWGLWNFTIYSQGFDNVAAEAGGFVDINIEDYAMKSQILDPTSTLWKGARFYNKANQAGILDPDSLMQKYDQAVDKAKTGRSLMVPCNWCRPNSDLKQLSPEMGMLELKAPAEYKMIGNLFKTPFTDRWSMAITTKCKEPEKAMTLVNFLNSDAGMRLMLNGIEGKHWNVGEDGVPRLTPETLAMLDGTTPVDEQDPEYSGFNLYSHLYGYAEGSWDAEYNCPAQFIRNENPVDRMAEAAPYQKDYAAHYGVEYPDQLFQKTLPDQGKIFDGSFTQMVELTPTEIKQIDDNLQNFLLVELVNIINAKTDADFDAQQARIIEDARQRGAEQAYEWHKNAYQTAISKVQSFYDSLK